MTPRISVVVSTYQRARRLPTLLHALESQSLPPDEYEVVIVDNGSTDDTAQVLKDLATTTRLDLRSIRIEENHGPAAARNLGWREARAPFVAFTDDDCRPDPDWLAAALLVLEAEPAVGVLQGRTNADPAVRRHPFMHTREVHGPSHLFEGCNLFVRRTAIAGTTGFDEELAFLGEDTAAGWAIVDAGWQAAYIDEAVVEHDVEEVPFARHLQLARLQGNLVKIGRDHPQARRLLFWRSHAYSVRNVVFTAALAGLVIGRRWRPGLLLAVPYVLDRRPRSASRAGGVLLAKHVAHDAAVFVGMLEGSLRFRRLTL